MKLTNWLCGLSLIGAVLQAACSPSQTTVPNIPNTVKFIESKLDSVHFEVERVDTYDGERFRSQEIFDQHVKMDGCMGHITVHLKTTQWDKEKSEWKIEQNYMLLDQHFDAKGLQLGSQTIRPWREREDVDRIVYWVDIPGSPGGVHVLTDNQQLAQRVENALIGLARLCGAKDEPY